jgi:hypothetical protein
MKKYISILLLATTIITSAFTIQGGVIEDVITALRSGNANQLSGNFDDNIELTLPDKSDNYSKAQAQLIVKDFFSNNGVKGFEVKHKGDSPGGGHFCIGTLHTNAGSFRTNVFMKIKNGKEVVKEIRFQAID